jgi:hypothetical protein
LGDLKNELARLRALTPKLNAATDRATKVVLAVERFLYDECEFGLVASIRVIEGRDEDESIESGQVLEYGRWDGRFKLLVYDFEAPCNGPTFYGEKTPWINAPRNKKLATVYAIPSLLREVGRVVEKAIREADSDTSTIEHFLADLGVKEGK